MCLTDIFRLPRKKSFKKCPSFGKKKKSRKLSRTSSTAPILRSSILKSTCNIYTLASLNSLINPTDSDGTDYTKSSLEYDSFDDSKHLQPETKNRIDSVPRTPLLEAAVAGQLSAIQWLLKHTGCSFNEKDTGGCNILHLAARKKITKLVQENRKKISQKMTWYLNTNSYNLSLLDPDIYDFVRAMRTLCPVAHFNKRLFGRKICQKTI